MQEQPIRPAHFVDQAAFDSARQACREFYDLNADLPYHDLLEALIELSIEAGADTQQAVIAAVHGIRKYPPAQIGTVLKKGSGSNPKLYRWHRTEAGRYVLNPPAPEA